jgi:hypothetical protein
MSAEQKAPTPGWPDGLYVVVGPSTPGPSVSWISEGRVDGESVGSLVIQCGCDPENTWHRLGNRRAVECLRCGRILARVGRQIIVGGQRL